MKMRYDPFRRHPGGSNVVDGLVDQNLLETFGLILRTTIWALLVTALLWACLPTNQALAASALLVFFLSGVWNLARSANNRDARVEMMRTRDVYALMAFSRLRPEGLDADGATAFSHVDRELMPVLGEAEDRSVLAAVGAGIRALAQNCGLFTAAAVLGFFLRPEAAQLIAWLDSHAR